MGYRQGEQHQRNGEHDCAAVIHAGVGEPLVGQEQQGDGNDGSLGHVEPEYASPAPDFDDGAAASRPQHTTRLGSAGDDAQGQPPFLRRHQRRRDGQADGHRATPADGLHHPRNDNLIQRVNLAVQPPPFPRQGDQRRSDTENQKGVLVDAGVAINVGQPAQQRHRHGVAQQVSGHHPYNRLQPGQLDFQVSHHRRQRRYHNRLVQGGDKGAGGDGRYHHPGRESVLLQSA